VARSVGDGERLRDAPAMLPRRPFCRDERRELGRFGYARLDGGEREAPGGVVRDRERIERVDANVLGVAAVRGVAPTRRDRDDIRLTPR
jgi:hypothetical protein